MRTGCTSFVEAFSVRCYDRSDQRLLKSLTGRPVMMNQGHHTLRTTYGGARREPCLRLSLIEGQTEEGRSVLRLIGKASGKETTPEFC